MAVLEHEALDTALARLLAQLRERFPARAVDQRRQHQAVRGIAGGETLELLAALGLRQLAQVTAALRQQVVADETGRRLGQDLLRERLASDALLQQREADRRTVLPDDDLAVDDAAVGPALGECHDLGKALGDQLLAARPDPDLPTLAHHLGTDAVVLPFDLPVGGRSDAGVEVVDGQVELVREEERERLAHRQRGGRSAVSVLHDGWRNQALVGRRIGPHLLVGVAHHPLGDELGIERGMLGQRALHQQLADADAEAAGDQLGQQEAAGQVEFVPVAGDRLRLLLGSRLAQRQQALLDPFGKPPVGHPVDRRQHERDRLAEIAHRLVALLEQPVVDAGPLAGDRPHQAARHDLARLAAGQEVDGPRGIGRLHLREVAAQRSDLVAGGGAGVECPIQLGKAAHQTGSAPAPSGGTSDAGSSSSGTCTSVTGTGECCRTADATDPGAPRPLPITTRSQP